MTFDRDTYFDEVRESLFNGSMDQGQVIGQNALLAAWEMHPGSYDPRWLAYCLATTFHETAGTMLPISEYGKGEGHDYGKPDPETGQAYYGRGFVQLTWKDNYIRASQELTLTGTALDLETHADRALDLLVAALVMFRGMTHGWFTGRQLSEYFNEGTDDPIGARRIINPDDKGKLIAGYHAAFLEALEASEVMA